MKENFPMLEETPSIKVHKRQAFWQITFPLIVTVLLILAVAVLTGISAFGEESGAGTWAAISTIWLVIPVMFIAFIFLVMLAAMIYGMMRLLKIIPPYTGKAQYYINRAADKIKTAADAATTPVIAGGGLIASLKALFGKK
jgi:uncharacterized membrane protein